MGVEGEKPSRQFQPWNYYGEVRCGVSVSRGIAAVPTAAAAGESAVGNGEVVKGFRGSGRGGLVTPPSPRSFSAGSNRLRQTKRSILSRARGRLSSRGGEVIDDCRADSESESSTTLSSTYPSLGRPACYSWWVGGAFSLLEA